MSSPSNVRSCSPGPRPSSPKGRALPVVRPEPIRKSRISRWRAAALILIQVLIALHAAHWLSTGETVTPLEPSEAMQFSKESIINAGLIFFGLMILSTLVLGRWFCGWACHIVAIQDLASWLFNKAGLRPKPIRSPLLASVPLLAFVYMFLAPPIYRLLAGLGTPAPALHLTTDDFWQTFPSWIPAILTLLTVGFFAVYLLGAKGFCFTACPYGGIFGVAEQLAPLRIRVTDACNGCGHCTAVCTSNVRVHEEVARYKAVVDAGCMKCLDCVSVCPNDALYYGVGKPALFTRSSPAAAPQARAARRSDFCLWVLLAAFCFAAYLVFWGADQAFILRPIDVALAGALTALTLALLFFFRGRSDRKRDYALGEEAALGVLFLLAMYAFRGLYGAVAFLFALGVAAVVAYLGLQALLLMRRRQLSLHRWTLKRAGRLQPAAYGFLAAMTLLTAFGAHSAAVQFNLNDARRTQRSLGELLDPNHDAHAANPALHDPDPAGANSPAVRALADRLLDRLRFVQRWSLVPDPQLPFAIAHALRLRGDEAAWEQALQRALEGDPGNAEACLELASHYLRTQQLAKALRWYQRYVDLRPDALDGRLSLGLLQTAAGDFTAAQATYEVALSRLGERPELYVNYGLLEAQRGNLPAAIARLNRAVQLAPDLLSARLALCQALLATGRSAAAINQAEAALRISPNDVDARILIAQAAISSSPPDLARAREVLDEALALAPDRADVQSLRAAVRAP